MMSIIYLNCLKLITLSIYRLYRFIELKMKGSGTDRAISLLQCEQKRCFGCQRYDDTDTREGNKARFTKNKK